MSIKFWEGEEDKEVFVRLDHARPDNPEILVWLCDSRGAGVPAGSLVRRCGECMADVNDHAAAKAGIELDDAGAITRDSLAQICAEMAKRIQGD